jgi:hypothetical protein
MSRSRDRLVAAVDLDDVISSFPGALVRVQGVVTHERSILLKQKMGSLDETTE